MRARDVSVRVERVLSMPHGGKLIIDGPPGEELVVWALSDQTDEDIADVLNRYLFEGQGLSGRRPIDLKLFAS